MSTIGVLYIIVGFPLSLRPQKTLEDFGIGYCEVHKSRSRLLADTFTKEDRQQLVEDFFREVFKDAFGVGQSGSSKKFGVKRAMSKSIAAMRRRFGKQAEPKDLVQCELTKSEFASSLGMKANSIFVEQIFNVVDEDNSSTIAYQEMLTFLVKFTKGDSDNKLRLMFRIYNTDGSGILKKSEFHDMLKHLLEGANTRVESDRFDQTLESMFSDAGLSGQEELTFDDFKRLFSPHLEQIMPGVRLEFPGVDTTQPVINDQPAKGSPRRTGTMKSTQQEEAIFTPATGEAGVRRRNKPTGASVLL